MRQTRKNKAHFVEYLEHYPKENVDTFSHPIGTTTKRIPASLTELSDYLLPQKYRHTWYLKRANCFDDAEREVLAQELFRLLIPGHSKTRLVTDRAGDAFVASKEVPGLEPLPSDWNSLIRSGRCTGLGELVTVALLLNEVDLKCGNLILNQHHQLIKLDGDWCFASLRHPNFCEDVSRSITPHTLASLPFPGDYQPYNWLGMVNRSVPQTPPSLDHDLSSHPRIRREIHNALLKIFLLPDLFLQHFIRTYVHNPTTAASLYEELTARRHQLRKAALKNVAFTQWLLENPSEGTICFEKYMQYLDTFKTAGKHVILHDLKDPEESFRQTYHHLLEGAQQAIAARRRLTGLTIGLTTAMILVTLRWLDVITLGLSLPATMLLALPVCGLMGVAMGHIVHKQLASPVLRLQDASRSQPCSFTPPLAPATAISAVSVPYSQYPSRCASTHPAEDLGLLQTRPGMAYRAR